MPTSGLFGSVLRYSFIWRSVAYKVLLGKVLYNSRRIGLDDSIFTTSGLITILLLRLKSCTSIFTVVKASNILIFKHNTIQNVGKKVETEAWQIKLNLRKQLSILSNDLLIACDFLKSSEQHHFSGIISFYVSFNSLFFS